MNWISVGERLPAPSLKVLVKLNYKENIYVVASCVDEEFWLIEWDYTELKLRDITHWCYISFP